MNHPIETKKHRTLSMAEITVARLHEILDTYLKKGGDAGAAVLVTTGPGRLRPLVLVTASPDPARPGMEFVQLVGEDD